MFDRFLNTPLISYFKNAQVYINFINRNMKSLIIHFQSFGKQISAFGVTRQILRFYYQKEMSTMFLMALTEEAKLF